MNVKIKKKKLYNIKKPITNMFLQFYYYLVIILAINKYCITATNGDTQINHDDPALTYENVTVVQSEYAEWTKLDIIFKGVNISENEETTIIGGKTASANEFPYMAMLLKRQSGSKYSFFCGGSLINSKTVLTAAHCAKHAGSPANLMVRLGEHDVRTKSRYQIDVQVNKIVIHESYNSKNSNINDIAVLKLSSAVRYSQQIGPVAMVQNPRETWANRIASLSGWGTVNVGKRQLASVLQKADFKVMVHKECQKAWAKQRVPVHGTQLCVYERARSACMGDSGGPLVVTVNGKKEQIGVVSWGSSKCTGMPAVFVRVSSYLEWIKKNSN